MISLKNKKTLQTKNTKKYVQKKSKKIDMKRPDKMTIKKRKFFWSNKFKTMRIKLMTYKTKFKYLRGFYKRIIL